MTVRVKPRAKWLLIILVPISLGAAGWLYFNRGMRVRIHNSDAQTLYSLVVSVTGQSYPLGDLASGSSVSVRVEPRGESSVLVEFRDGTGRQKRFDAEGYYESGYRGTLSLEIDAQRILRKTDNVSIGP